MTSGPVLLDTSAWIGYLRPRGWKELKTAVSEALEIGNIVTCWVVKAELLIGARDDESFAKLLALLEAVPEVSLTDSLWEATSRLGYRLRKQGLLIPLPDLVIAQVALEHHLVLWHADEDFERIRRTISLKTRSFLS